MVGVRIRVSVRVRLSVSSIVFVSDTVEWVTLGALTLAVVDKVVEFKDSLTTKEDVPLMNDENVFAEMVRESEKLDDDVPSSVSEYDTDCDRDCDFDLESCCENVSVGESRLGENDIVFE